MYAKNIGLDGRLDRGAFGGLRSSMDLFGSFGYPLLAENPMRKSLLAPAR